MFDDHDLPVATHAAAMNDATGLGSEDRCALLCRDVDPIMASPTAPTETRAQAAPDRPGKAQRTLLTGSGTCTRARIRRCPRRRLARTGRADGGSAAIRSRNEQTLSDAKRMSIADAIGTRDPSRVDSIAEANPIEILPRSDVMGHTRLAARATDGQERCREEDKEARPRKNAQKARTVDTPVSISNLLGPSNQSVFERCLRDIEWLARSRWRKARPL